ncbi:MAG: glycosyltransferase family 2 protein [Bacteroidetes bacterium]|nr:glycosyltransferase family 2 protein [Bacteroidota bacterium]
MQVTGFTFIRNAILYDYPVVESIRSILSLCDEFVVAVGKSDDNTRELIASMNSPRIKIIDTVWDESLKEGGAVLAKETNKALDAISPESTWAFYIQADEVIHEQYLERLMLDMERYKNDLAVEGLLLNYLHFYGSYDYTGDSRRWYRKEVRIIRNDRHIRSYRDAQGFRKNGKPLIVQPVKATIYHYGWVKPPEFQQAKQQYFNRLWHDEKWIAEHIASGKTFDYSRIDTLAKFTGTHPAVMKDRIEKKNWHFSFDPSKKRFSPVKMVLHFIEQKTGWRPGEYRNYRIM